MLSSMGLTREKVLPTVYRGKHFKTWTILDIVCVTVTQIEEMEILIPIHPRFYGDPSKILCYPVNRDYWNLGIHVGDIPRDERIIVYKEFEHSTLYTFGAGVYYAGGYLGCDGYFVELYWSHPLCKLALSYP